MQLKMNERNAFNQFLGFYRLSMKLFCIFFGFIKLYSELLLLSSNITKNNEIAPWQDRYNWNNTIFQESHLVIANSNTLSVTLFVQSKILPLKHGLLE